MSESVKILITGNGFDIAHGLQTGYTDFLDFCKHVKNFCWHLDINSQEGIFLGDIKTWKLNEQIKDEFIEAFKTRENLGIFNEIKRLTVNNVWIDFMSRVSNSQAKRGINWVDFETEIKNVISFVDRTESDLTSSCVDLMNKFALKNYIQDLSAGDIEKLSIFNECLRNAYYDEHKHEEVKKYYPLTVRDFRKYIYDELEDLIRALELYLAHFINHIECKPLPLIAKIRPDYVLNFNYTNTFERVYPDVKPEIIYVHGKCDEAEHENNMILGINEYWRTDEEIMSNVNYAIFKKYVQRIRKRTVYQYRPLKKLVKANEASLFFVHIFGHSLDVTDKDILADFLSSPRADITVYYHNKESEGELIAKMIALTGAEYVIESVNNNRLRFCKSFE
ncbi:MAG: bacteriophage abortive infection AbiH family protein [Synergistaceae bacterium]|nr:bacteriophage abortive infection AbiH family protein [Synergistaceae bacterium]